MKHRFAFAESCRLLATLFFPFLLFLHSGCNGGTIYTSSVEKLEEPFTLDSGVLEVDSATETVDGPPRSGTQAPVDDARADATPPTVPPSNPPAPPATPPMNPPAPVMPSLTTGNPAYDRYDGAISNAVARFGFPDPLFIKAQLYHESNFNHLATSKDSPCGIPSGWTDPQAKSYGLMQITPACTGFAIAANGRPNLTTDPSSPDWATSAYHPGNNIYFGVSIMTEIWQELKADHPGCKASDYLLMTAAVYNSGPNAVTGCALWNTRGGSYVQKVSPRYRELADLAGQPYPF